MDATSDSPPTNPIPSDIWRVQIHCCVCWTLASDPAATTWPVGQNSRIFWNDLPSHRNFRLQCGHLYPFWFNGPGGPMTERTEAASGGYKALLGATLKAMHIAESNGRMDEAGLMQRTQQR
jgi:hypothetical protein